MKNSIDFIGNFLQTNLSSVNKSDLFQNKYLTVFDQANSSLETKIKNSLFYLDENKFKGIREVFFCQKIELKKLRQIPTENGFYFLLNDIFGKILDQEAERLRKFEAMKFFKVSFKAKMEKEFSPVWQRDFSIDDDFLRTKAQKIVEIILYYALSFKELGNTFFSQRFTPLINLLEKGICLGINGNVVYFWEFESSFSQKQIL